MDYYECSKHSNYALHQRRIEAERYRLAQTANPDKIHPEMLNRVSRRSISLLLGIIILIVMFAGAGVASAQAPVFDPGGIQDNPAAYAFWTGLKAVQSGQYELAIEKFSDSIDFAPDYMPAYVFRATAYYLSGAYESALADFDSAIALNPDYSSAYN